MNPEPLATPSLARRSREYLFLCSAVAAIALGLLVYSQTYAFAADEGFHLLAAQLIAAGKRPYLDFFFPQTPLNAYWNAFWFHLFGSSWRVAHTIAAAMTSGAILLTADLVFVRFPVLRWRLAAALTAAALFGLNVAVVQFSTVGQAYGLCLFLIVAAFRAAIASRCARGLLMPALAGCLAGAAAASSLLTAPVSAILLIWLAVYNGAGARWTKCCAFVAGSGIACTPLLWLFAASPDRVKFNVLDYHWSYRQVHWSNAVPHDLSVMFSWLDSSQALLLGILAIAGLLFVRFQSGWLRGLRAEWYLCGWLSLGMAAHLGTAHPTFERYFILIVPFLAIPASTGLYSIAARLYPSSRPLWTTLTLTFLLSLSLAKCLYDGRDDRIWPEYEIVAKKINAVTPPAGYLLAEEPFYFLTRRTPPAGMEHSDSHKLELPAALAERLHIVPGSELNRRIKEAAFDSVQTCDSEEYIKKIGLPGIYKHKEDVEDCAIFWR